MDSVVKAYLGMLQISEMSIPTRMDGSILTSLDVKDYKENKKHLDVKQIGDYEVGYIGNSSQGKYVTYKEGEPIHSSEMEFKPAGTNNMPFPHDYQSVVNQSPKHRGVSRMVMHHHVENSGRPFATGAFQTDKGNEMWMKFAKESLERGHHVYFWDGANLHKSNSENLKNHLDSYYGGDKIQHRMIVSKEPIS